MNPVARALWFIESRFASELTLDDIARSACVTRFHLSRAFEAATGRPVIRYVRARRLTEAARQLAAGAPDILAVAIDAGYGSHEAFTRAFREQFGLTPDALRARGHLNQLELVEPNTMNESFIDDLAPPRFEATRPLLIAGLSERYTCESGAGIPAQWQRFAPRIGHVPGELGEVTYGVCCNPDDAGNFDYVCGVEVADFSALPDDLDRVRIPAQRYAVFTHNRHISEIRSTWNTVWNRWLPASGQRPADAPVFERYDERFDPRTGMGDVELWLPVEG